MSGLFSLWAAWQTDVFSGCAAASPSVWFPGWMDFTGDRAPGAGSIYLSLGDREEKTRNQVMSRVGGCIREMDARLDAYPGVKHTLEWNPGNHFRDPELRTAKAFAWCVNNLEDK